MLVRLTMKLANLMDGVDLSRFRQGDLVELSDADATLLIAEGWARHVGRNGDGVRGHVVIPDRELDQDA